MKFTYSWLKDYVDISLKPEELADKLTMAGLEVEALDQKEGEWIFEAEVTTNRPDWLSIYGIAREVAAITGKKLKAPVKKSIKTNSIKPEIKVLDVVGCPRYTGRIISNVKVGPSPEWLEKRIKAIGLRPVNNIVDISNFVLFETGQPLHAFDFDKLTGGKIIVRKAKDGEEIVSIDGIKRKLSSSTLVIADEKTPVAIAGIMGGKNTEVTESTKTILLESAYFNPAMIRRASKSLGLGSDSSYRFERGVDFQAVAAASDRATLLIFQAAGGEAGKLTDVQAKNTPSVKISVRPQKVNDLLGIEVPQKKMISILKSLGLVSTAASKTKLSFTAPSWRQDLKNEIDLVEEIIRIYGYEKIPVVQPKDINVLDRIFVPKQLEFQSLIRDTLVSFGLNEVINYSLTDKELDSVFQPEDTVGNIAIKNPLSPELALLRRNLLAGLLSSARWNLNRNISDIKLFEIGPVYLSDKLDKEEESCLGICLSGRRSDNWQDGAKQADFYYLKGTVEALLAKLGVNKYEFVSSENKIFSSDQSARLVIGAETIGFLGKVKKDLLSKIDIEKDCFVCQLNLNRLIKYIKQDRKYSALPKFPAVYRDISTLVGQDIPSASIVSLIKEEAGSIISDVKLFDVYRGQQIPKGHKSLIYRLTYQSSDKTLTDAEVEVVHSKITSLLKEKLGVQIR